MKKIKLFKYILILLPLWSCGHERMEQRLKDYPPVICPFCLEGSRHYDAGTVVQRHDGISPCRCPAQVKGMKHIYFQCQHCGKEWVQLTFHSALILDFDHPNGWTIKDIEE